MRREDFYVFFFIVTVTHKIGWYMGRTLNVKHLLFKGSLRLILAQIESSVDKNSKTICERN